MSQNYNDKSNRDAIIFIPGLGGKQSTDTIAMRIASGLDLSAKTAKSEFKLKAGYDEDYDTKGDKALNTRVRTIVWEKEKESKEVADLYQFHYFDSLTKKYSGSNDFAKAVRLFFVLLVNFPSFIAAIFRKSEKTIPEKLQFLFGIGLLGLFTAYFVVLVVAIYHIIVQVPQVQSLLKLESATSSTSFIAQIIIVVIAVIEAFKPSFKQSFSLAAQQYLSVVEYLSVGSRGPVLSGQFEHLLDHVQAKGYRRVIVVGYSFGSIFALDNFFPREREPATRIQQVDTLVTIGSPFEIIRVFWPKYFEKRGVDANVPKRWINVFSPDDIMGSNITKKVAIKDYKDETAGFPPEEDNILYKVGPSQKKTSLLGALGLVGLQEHAIYWEEEFEFGHSAFDEVVKKLYQETDILA